MAGTAARPTKTGGRFIESARSYLGQIITLPAQHPIIAGAIGAAVLLTLLSRRRKKQAFVIG